MRALGGARALQTPQALLFLPPRGAFLHSGRIFPHFSDLAHAVASRGRVLAWAVWLVLKLHPQLATAARKLTAPVLAGRRASSRTKRLAGGGTAGDTPSHQAWLRYRLAGRERTTTCHAAVPGPWPLLPSTPSSPAPTATGLNEKTNLRKKKPCLSPRIAFIGRSRRLCARSLRRESSLGSLVVWAQASFNLT